MEGLASMSNRRTPNTELPLWGKFVVVLLALALTSSIRGQGPSPLKTLIGHPAAVMNVRFSRDDKILAATSHKSVFLWSVQTGKLARSIDHQSFVTDVDFSPVGKTL